MTREQQLEYCSVCNNQKFDMQQGIVCRLTNKVADFEGTCDSFDENKAYKEEWQKKNQEQKVRLGQVGAVTRFTHYAIDSAVIVLLVWGIGWLVKNMVSLYTWYHLPPMYFYIAYLGLKISYYTLMETFTGKTIAKILTKTKVTNPQGERPHFLVLLVRSMARLIPFEPLSFFNNEALGWHDKATETVVIYDE